jgi:chromosome segregation ATPase
MKNLKELARELEDKKMKLNNLEVEIMVLKKDITRLEKKQNKLKIRPMQITTETSGLSDVHYITVQTLRDVNGCVIAENDGWDNDCALHYSEEVLNHIVNYKEFYDIEAVINVSEDSVKTRAYFVYKGIL